MELVDDDFDEFWLDIDAVFAARWEVNDCLFYTGNFEVGVHIADVSYFVGEDNALDAIASQRATSVYMVQKVRAPWQSFTIMSCFIFNLKIRDLALYGLFGCFDTAQVIPMLPRLLCEELCSLNPLTDRLTFSVIWKITPEGKVWSFRIHAALRGNGVRAHWLRWIVCICSRWW